MMIKNAYKHLVKFTGSAARPVLEGFYFSEEGHVVATDSHVLARVRNAVPAGNSFILNPKTLTAIDDTYPEYSRLFPAAAETATSISVDSAKSVSRYLKTLSKNDLVSIEFSGNTLTLVAEGHELEISLLKTVDESLKTVMAVNVLRRGIDLLADLPADTVIEIWSTSPVHPLYCFVPDVLDILLIPVRKGISA